MELMNGIDVDPLPSPTRRSSPFFAPITAAFASWVVVALGFLGLHYLLQERPQFVGQPLSFSSMGLRQESPRLFLRKSSDDVSVFQEIQPEQSEVSFDLQGRRDYRGLRTIIDMEGTFRGKFTITNPYPEPAFVLFQSPHPRNQDSKEIINARALKLNPTREGIYESTAEASIWSGRLEAQETLSIEVTYQASNLREVRFSWNSSLGLPVKRASAQIRVADVPSVLFESADGLTQARNGTAAWERSDFLPPIFSWRAWLKRGASSLPWNNWWRLVRS